MAHGFPVAAIKGEGHTDLLLVVAGDLEAIRAPARVGLINGDLPVMTASLNPAGMAVFLVNFGRRLTVSAPSFARRRQANNWFGAMPCRRATWLTVMPGSIVSAMIASFSAGVRRRRTSRPVRTSLFGL
jgi:hypothetical protein